MRARATADIDALYVRQARELATQQAQSFSQQQEVWEALLRNEPDVVAATLNAAFNDNEVPSACVAVAGDEAMLVITAPDPLTLPEQIPALTASGNPTLRRLNKTDQSQLYAQVVAGHAALTLKECFAVAPSLRNGRLIAVRVSDSGDFEAVLATRATREAVAHADWSRGPLETLATIGELRIERRGRTRQMVRLDVTNEDEIAEILQLLDATPEMAE